MTDDDRLSERERGDLRYEAGIILSEGPERDGDGEPCAECGATAEDCTGTVRGCCEACRASGGCSHPAIRPPEPARDGATLTDDEREALFTENHHPDFCDCSAYVIEQAFAEDCCCSALLDTFAAVERIVAARERAAERRGAVEALRDAAGDWSDWDALDAPEDWLRDRAARLDRDRGA